MSERDFDLNIEKVLDGWKVSHAIRELIANALDEQALSRTRDIEIARVGRTWQIRDFGRGLRHQHLTQNENAEKRQHETEVVGRFGVGLKDALAVLDRRGVGVRLCSAHGKISLVHRPKAGFADVTTLHARIGKSPDRCMVGTTVLLDNVDDASVEDAKSFFLQFAGEPIVERTKFGQILRRSPARSARIYVNGLLVAEEPDFAFSYNVTAMTQAMRKALNRERTNVGRSAYSERVKSMLLVAESEAVAEALAKDVEALSAGTSHEEVRTWVDVGLRACEVLNAKRRVVFVTAEQLVAETEMVDRAIGDGRQVITVPATIGSRLVNAVDIDGNPLQSLGQFRREWSESIEFKFVPEKALTPRERSVFSLWRDIATLSGGLPSQFKELKVSETMRPSVTEGMHPAGLWEPGTGRVIIHRSQLKSLEAFAGTLLHELTHARTGCHDVSRDFELALTSVIGKLAARSLRSTGVDVVAMSEREANER